MDPPQQIQATGPSLLPNDLLRNFLKIMPLYEFQKLYAEETQRSRQHQLSFKDRFFLRYQTQFPEVNQKFDNEEDQYLFCAYHFYGEIGLCSHLFTSTKNCLYAAVDLEDSFLVRYFLQRTDGSYLHGLIEYALQNQKYKVIPILAEDLFPHQGLELDSWQLPIDVARHFHKFATPNLAVVTYANLPIEELPTFEEFLEMQKQINDSADEIGTLSPALHGLILSGDAQKRKMAVDYLSSFIWSEEAYWNELCVVLQLDDLILFQKAWSKIEHLMYQAGEEPEIDGTKFYLIDLYYELISNGAVKITAWVLKNVDDTRSDLDDLFDPFEPEIIAWSTDPKNQLKVLEMFMAKYPGFGEIEVASFVWLRNSDPRALSVYQQSTYFNPLLIALGSGTEDFQSALIQQIITDLKNDPETEFNDSLNLDFKSMKKLIALGMPQNLLRIENEARLSYPEYLELLSWDVSYNENNSLILPTDDLYNKFRAKLNETGYHDIILVHVLKREAQSKLQPATERSFILAIRDHNYEYLACKAEQFRGKTFKNITRHNHQKMADFLRQYQIEYIPESKRRSNGDC